MVEDHASSPDRTTKVVRMGNHIAIWGALRKLGRTVRRWLKLDPDRFLESCSCIVHVGANSGQERHLYSRFGLTVVWIEPIPAIYEQLVYNIQSHPKQTAIRALLTDHAGDAVKLNISNNSGESSSIFDLAQHKDIWPEVDYVDQLQLESETLDGLVERGNSFLLRLMPSFWTLKVRSSWY